MKSLHAWLIATYAHRFMTRVRIHFACACVFMRVHACERVLLMLFNACNMRVERVSDACVIELVAGLYHISWLALNCEPYHHGF